MHRLLQRQLRLARIEPTALPRDILSLLELIDDAFEQFDDERDLLDRSLKISSAELFHRNRLMRAVFMALPDVFLWITCDGIIKDCKGGLQQYFGLEPATLFNENICHIPRLADPEIFSAALRELPAVQMLQVEYALRTDGQQVRHYEARFAQLDQDMYLVLIRDISDRAQAEDALRATQDRLDHVIEFLPDAIIAVDNDNRIIVWNKAVEEMTGIPKEEMLGRGDFEYAVPFYGERRPILLNFIGKDPSHHYSVYKRDKDNPQTLVAEVFVPCLRNGRGSYVWAKATPLLDGNGNVVGALQSVRDITEKKSAELTTQILYQVSTLASTPMSNSELFSQVHDILQTHLHAGNFLVQLVDPNLGSQKFPFLSASQDASYDDLHLPGHLAAEAIRSGSLIRHTDAKESHDFWLALPLRSGEQIAGSMVVQLSEHTLGITPEDASLLTAVADHLALAIARNATEQALRSSEEKHRSIFENATEGIFQVSLDHALLSANPAMAQILGYASVAALMQDSANFLQRYFPQNDRLLILDRLAKGGSVKGFELCTVKHDSSPTWLSVNMRAVKRTDGSIRHLEGSLEDISKRKEAERKLAIQKSQFQQLFDNSPQGILLLGADGTPVDLNPAFTELFGFSHDEMENILETLLPPDQLNQEFNFLGAVLSGKTMTRETERRHKDGRDIPVSILGYPYLQDGKISGAFFIFSDISERKHYEERLTFQALRDSLTGLPNRVLFMDRLHQAMERQKRREEFLFAVLMIDLDGFKRVNDSLGHQAGDALLCEIGKRLSSGLRSTDTVARMGGDEFAILLEDILDQQEAVHITKRLLAEIRQPMAIMGRTITASASMGLVLHTSRYTTPDELLRDADISMYRSKEQGKNQFKLFSTTMYEEIVQTVQLENDLRKAITENELTLYFQPIFDIASSSLHGFEALMRWNHPEQGLIPPNRFISIAEDAGMITEITQWVLRQGCMIMAKWNQSFAAAKSLTLSMNLSPRDLAHPSLVSDIEEILAESGIDPHQIKLEITESAVMDHPDQAITKLHQIKTLGLQLAMDDFGTGYSSLSYLHRFPVDVLKIDRSFIQTMLENPNNLEIIRTIIGLGKILDLWIVAEGVETEDQLQILRELQCDFAQGYLLGKPQPWKDTELLLASFNRHH